MSTPAQIAANHRNSQLSTGLNSEDGKAKSSLNAVKTGLTGRTVLLPIDDAALYEAHLAQFTTRLEPATEEERALVQSLADTDWRLQRIPSLELGIFALGRLELADAFSNEDPTIRPHLIEAKIWLTYQRQLNNLSIQEARLRRQRENDLAALRELQANRNQQTEAHKAAALDQAALRYIRALDQNRDHAFNPSAFGFEFSLDEIQIRAMELIPTLPANLGPELAQEAA